MNLQEEYKKETNEEVMEDIYPDYWVYTNAYVEWLEAKVNKSLLNSSSLTLKGKDKKLFKVWKIYLDKTINNTYLINGKEYLESELVTVYKEIMDL